MVAAGVGIGYVSRLSVKQELASGQLVEIHCAKLQMKRSLDTQRCQNQAPVRLLVPLLEFNQKCRWKLPDGNFVGLSLQPLS
jgi:DNA-binding transcriptional LysR family regulator